MSASSRPSFLRFRIFASGLLLALAVEPLTGCTSTPSQPFSSVSSAETLGTPALKPPVAEEKPTRLEKHGDVRIDPYFWLKQRDDRDVIAYLRAENQYTDAVLKPTEGLQGTLLKEFKNRIKADDVSVPKREGEYEYYSRVESGKEYPIYCRRKVVGAGAQNEEILIDVNALAKGHAYFQVTLVSVSPNARLLAYAVDTRGDRVTTIYFKDLTTGKPLDERIETATGNLEWANDSRTVFYAKLNPTTLRSEKVMRHMLGERTDREIYFEKDETFDVYVNKSLSNRFLFLGSASKITTEVRYLDANKPDGEFVVFEPRKRGREYDVEDGGDRFFVRTNDGAMNFRLMEAPYGKTRRAHWKQVIPHRSDTFIESFMPTRSHLVIQEKNQGLTHIRIIDRVTQKSVQVPFPDPAYNVSLDWPREFDVTRIRYEYESLTTPESTFEHDLASGKEILLKRREIPGGFNSENYVSQRLFAKSKDGVLIPISLVMNKNTRKGASTPLLIDGYGSYGMSSDPWFMSDLVSLLDRGFIFAIAHVRGGSEMGRKWYEDGKLFKKKNTFKDFVTVTEFLHKEGFSSPAHTYAMGRSAGGLLMGAVLNMRPDLYNGVLAGVPFVDVVTTMLDASIPLTTSEYDEWGNPNRKKDYLYMKSYSPYDNVTTKPYTNILVTTGLNDSQVAYWEPAKWVARLRKLKTDNKLVLMHTNMEAGHGGKSGRFERLHLRAMEYAFLLSLEGQAK